MGKRWHRIREAILNNKKLKLVALVLAIVAWFAIQQVIKFENTVTDVPLTIQVDKGWAIMDQTVSTVDVLFRGSQETIRTLTRDRCEVVVDIRGRPLQTVSTVKLEPKYARAPGGARAILIQPERVALTLDQEGDKQVGVTADLVGIAPAGFEVEKVVITPASVLLHGPQQRLREIDSVRTAPIELEGRSRSFKLRASLVPPSDRWVARMEPVSVVVDVSITERSSEKEIKDARVSTLISPELTPRVKLTPSRVDLVLSGRPDLIDELQKEDVRAYVDCLRLEPSTIYDLPVRVHTVPGLSVKSINPATIKVEMGSR
jgi:YbbR domain-containing protein